MRYSVNNKILRDVTRRIVASVNPRRVLLFGSAARGEMKSESDLDVLVIMRAPVHRRRTAQKIYRNLHGAGIAVDVVVATDQDIKQYGQKPGTVLNLALQEGLVLYDA
ncbi:MAG: nucleotidyltransferase domain-containing protein [Anaerolineales bacterium]